MSPATRLDAAIDRLYQLPLDEFTAARNELARQSRGEEAKAVRALAKPNVVAWALNQIYWSARPVFEQLMAAAGRLRETQAAILRGHRGDLRAADDGHREALGAAVAEATKILESAGHPVTPDALRALTAAFEALPWADPPGRLVRPPSPSGFGVFAGMPILETQRAPGKEPQPGVPSKRTSQRPARQQAAAKAVEEEEEGAREREARRRQAREAVDAARWQAVATDGRLRSAEEQLARAREDERQAHRQHEEARRLLQEAETAHRAAARDAQAARTALDQAETAARRNH